MSFNCNTLDLDSCDVASSVSVEFFYFISSQSFGNDIQFFIKKCTKTDKNLKYTILIVESIQLCTTLVQIAVKSEIVKRYFAICPNGTMISTFTKKEFHTTTMFYRQM